MCEQEEGSSCVDHTIQRERPEHWISSTVSPIMCSDYWVREAKKDGKNIQGKSCTIFCGASEVVDNLNGVSSVNMKSLPPNAYAAYYDSEHNDMVSVFAMRYGAGHVIYLGFDWFSPTNRSQWKDLLRRAVLQEDPDGCIPARHGVVVAPNGFAYHSEFRKECAMGEVLSGVRTLPPNGAEDRKWSFACSKAHGLKLILLLARPSKFVFSWHGMGLGK